MGLGGQQGALAPPPYLWADPTEDLHLASPILFSFCFTALAGGRATAWSVTVTAQPMKSHYPSTPSGRRWTFCFCNSPSNLPLFSGKELPLICSPDSPLDLRVVWPELAHLELKFSAISE